MTHGEVETQPTPLQKQFSSTLLREESGRLEVMHEIAFRACKIGGVEALQEVAENRQLPMLDLLELTNQPDFKELLRKYTFTCNYLPRHKSVQEARIDDAITGDNPQERRRVLAVFMGEEEGEDGKVTLTETRSLSVDSPFLQKYLESLGQRD